MVEKAIYSRLIANAAVLALVSTRVHPELAPQDSTLPYLVMTRISTQHLQSKSNTEGLAFATMQINSVAATYLAAKELADKVRLALQGFRGSSGGITVNSIIPQGELDGEQFGADGTEKSRHRVIQDFRVCFNETAPS